MICLPRSDGVYATVHLVPVEVSEQDSPLNVPAFELVKETVPGSPTPFAERTVAVQSTCVPVRAILGEQCSVVVVGTSWVVVDVEVEVVEEVDEELVEEVVVDVVEGEGASANAISIQG
jgi:hypothetical protein